MCFNAMAMMAITRQSRPSPIEVDLPRGSLSSRAFPGRARIRFAVEPSAGVLSVTLPPLTAAAPHRRRDPPPPRLPAAASHRRRVPPPPRLSAAASLGRRVSRPPRLSAAASLGRRVSRPPRHPAAASPRRRVSPPPRHTAAAASPRRITPPSSAPTIQQTKFFPPFAADATGSLRGHGATELQRSPPSFPRLADVPYEKAGEVACMRG
jgi:hypothetical protein